MDKRKALVPILIIIILSIFIYPISAQETAYLYAREYAESGGVSNPENILDAPDQTYADANKGDFVWSTGYNTTGLSGTIFQVYFEIYYYGDVSGTLAWAYQLDDGGFNQIEDLPEGGDAGSPLFRSYNATNLRGTWTWANINATDVQFQNNDAGGPEHAYVDAIYIKITYNESVGEDYVCDITQSISWSGSAYREWDSERSLSQSVSWSGSVYRTWDSSRSLTQSVSWSGIVYREWDSERSFSQILSFTINVYRSWDIIRTLDQSIDWSSSIHRSWTLSRAFSQSLTFSWNAFGKIFRTFKRSASLGLTFTSNLFRQVDFARFLTQSIDWIGNIYRTWNMERTINQGLIFVWNAYGKLNLGAQQYIRDITLSLNWGANLYRSWNIDRTLMQGVKLFFNIYRSWNLERTFNQGLTFTWNTFSKKWINYVRSISLGINWSSNIYRKINFHLVLSQSLKLIFDIPESNILQVLVKTLRGVGIENALVTISNPFSGEINWAEYTDSTGFTQEYTMGDGNYTILVSKEDYQTYNLLFSLNESSILEIPLKLVEEGIMFNMELLIFTGMAGLLLIYAWGRPDENGMIAGAISVITWFASGLWFMWSYINTEKVHFWYLFELFALVALFVTIRNILALMENVGKKAAWDDYYD